jgi:hypothetical protein
MRPTGLLASGLALTIASASHAQTGRLPAIDSLTNRLAVTVSGGVSLGAYQAGSTWALIFALRSYDRLVAARQRAERVLVTVPPLPQARYGLDVLTGASAGNINALLAAFTYCQTKSPTRPDSSLFWHSWIPIGFLDLVKPPMTPEDRGVFSRAAFGSTWERLTTAMKADSAVANCDLLLGITATKVTPESFRIANGVNAPVQRFAGVFRMVSDSTTGGLALVEPRQDDVVHQDVTDILILDPELDTLRQPSPLGRDVRVAWPSIRALVEASGAFPVAFSPRQIPYRLLDSLRWDREQPPGQTAPPCRLRMTNPRQCEAPLRDRFVDGGVFDNRPLGLAKNLSSALAQSRASAELLSNDAVTAGIKTFTEDCARDASAAGFSGVYSMLAGPTPRREATPSFRAQFERLAPFVADSSLTESCRAAARRLVMQRATAAESRRLNRLLYFIDDDARRGVDTLTEQREKRESAGGLSSAVSVLLTAFETGSNTEMRIFGQDLRDSSSKYQNVRLGVNSRYPRLMAEHFNHFGAFLARTFREHDFYAGVYDGLRSAFRELYCPVSAPDAPIAKGEACDAAWLRIALDQNVLQLDTAGRVLVLRFLEREDRRGSVPAATPQADPLAQRLLMLAEANVLARQNRNPRCPTHALLVEQPLCTFQFVGIMESWSTLLSRKERDTLEDDDNDAGDFLRDPYAEYHEVLLKSIEKAYKAEAKLDRQRETGHPGFVQIPLYFERAYNESYRSAIGPTNMRPVDLNPTTSDVLGHWWYSASGRILPHHAEVMKDGSSRWLAWRPTAYIYGRKGLSFAVTTPLELRLEHGETVRAAGVGTVISVPMIPLVSSVSVSRLRGAHNVAANDVTVSFFTSLVRLGWRAPTWEPRTLFTFEQFTLGVGDVNGLSSRLIGFTSGLPGIRWVRDGTWSAATKIGRAMVP